MFGMAVRQANEGPTDCALRSDRFESKHGRQCFHKVVRDMGEKQGGIGGMVVPGSTRLGRPWYPTNTRIGPSRSRRLSQVLVDHFQIPFCFRFTTIFSFNVPLPTSHSNPHGRDHQLPTTVQLLPPSQPSRAGAEPRVSRVRLVRVPRSRAVAHRDCRSFGAEFGPTLPCPPRPPPRRPQPSSTLLLPPAWPSPPRPSRHNNISKQSTTRPSHPFRSSINFVRLIFSLADDFRPVF